MVIPAMLLAATVTIWIRTWPGQKKPLDMRYNLITWVLAPLAMYLLTK